MNALLYYVSLKEAKHTYPQYNIIGLYILFLENTISI